MADQGADGQRVQLQLPVPRHLQHAQHLQRLGAEIPPGGGQQLAVRQHEALGEQGAVRHLLQRRRAEGGADDGRLHHCRHARHVARGQEVVAHEALHAVLPAVLGVTHARAHHRLHVEGQPLLGAPGDVVEVEAHRPQEVPGAAGVLGLPLHQDAAARAVRPDQLAHDAGVEHVARHPVHGLEVPQAAAPLLDVRLDQERALAEAAVAHVALGLLGGDEVRGAGGAGGGEAAGELRMQRHVPGEQPRVDHGCPHRDVPLGLRDALADRARGVADLQAEVPQEVQAELDGGERLGRGLLGRDEQQVDVAERRQHAPAVAASGHHGERRLGAQRCPGIAVERRHDPVRQLGEQAGALQAGQLAMLELVADVLLDARQVAAERGQGRVPPQRPVERAQVGQGFVQGHGAAGRFGGGCVGQHSVDDSLRVFN